MISEKTILALQVIAAIFMAADYFFADRQRDEINSWIQKLIQPQRERAQDDMNRLIEDMRETAIPLLVAILFSLISVLGIQLLEPARRAFGNEAAAVLAVILFILAAVGVSRLVRIVVERSVVVTVTSAAHLTLEFLHRCPKGTVFGIGLLFLIASFLCRWYNLSPHA